MAKSLITRHEIESLVNMKLSAESEKEMKSKLAKIFDGADIDFNSKEFERSFKNIVTAFNAVFKEAGVDAVDLMPGKEEFKKLGEIAYNEFMSAWKTVGEKGGIKFNFNTDQLDEVIDKLDIIAKNTAKTTKKSLNKSADEINAAIYRLDKAQEKYESIKKAIEYDGKGSKPRQSTIERLEREYHGAENWEEQYQYLIKYVKTYEKLNELGTVDFTKGQTDLYKTLSKQVDQAKTALSNLLITKEQISAGVAVGGGNGITIDINGLASALKDALATSNKDQSLVASIDEGKLEDLLNRIVYKVSIQDKENFTDEQLALLKKLPDLKEEQQSFLDAGNDDKADKIRTKKIDPIFDKLAENLSKEKQDQIFDVRDKYADDYIETFDELKRELNKILAPNMANDIAAAIKEGLAASNSSISIDENSLKSILSQIIYKVQIQDKQSGIESKITELSSDLKKREEFGFYNSKTGNVSKTTLGTAESANVKGKDLNQIDPNWRQYDATFHNHPDVSSVTASMGDLNYYLEKFNEFKKHIIVGQNEILQFDFSKLTKDQIEAMSAEYEKKLDEIRKEFNVENADGKADPKKVQALAEKYGTYDDAGAASLKKKQEALLSIFKDAAKVSSLVDFNDSLRKGNQGLQSNIDGAKKVTIDEASLKSLLEGVIYSVKIVDDNKPTSEDTVVKNVEENKSEQIDPDIDKKIADAEYIIKNANAWLKMLDGLLDEHSFDKAGKKEATDSLKMRKEALNDYYANPTLKSAESYAEEKRIVAWNRAYQEALRQNVAQSTLDKNYDAAAAKDYPEALKTLQKEREYWAKTLSEKETQLSILKNEKETGKAVNNQSDKTSDAKQSNNNIQKLDTTAEVESLENVRAKVEAIKTEVGNKTQAFTEEEAEVKRVVNEEINALEPLEAKVKSIKDAIKGLNEQTPTENPSTNAQPNENIKPEDSNLINNEDLTKITQLRDDIKIVAENIKSIIDNVVTDETSLQKSIRSVVTQIHSAITAERAQLGKLNGDIEKLQENLTGLFKNITTGETNIAAGLSNINVTVNHPETKQNDLEPLITSISNLIGKLNSETTEHKDAGSNYGKKEATEATAQRNARSTQRININSSKIYSTLKSIKDKRDIVGALTNLSNVVAKDETLKSFIETVNQNKTNENKETEEKEKKDHENEIKKQAEELGELQARQDVSGNVELAPNIARLQKLLDGLSEEDKKLAEVYSHKSYASTVGNLNLDKEVQRNLVIKDDLRKLYRQLGAMQGEFAATGKSNSELSKNIDDIKKEIEAKEKLIEVNKALRNNFDEIQRNSKNNAITSIKLEEEKQWEKDFNNLKPKYEELGKLEAQAIATEDPIIATKKEQLEKIIEQEYARLDLNKEQNQERANELKTLREIARKNEQAIQTAKQQKVDLKTQVKNKREQTRQDKARTVWRSGQNTLLDSFWKMENFSEEFITQIPDVQKLQSVLDALKQTRDALSLKKADQVTEKEIKQIKSETAEVQKQTEAVKELIKNYEFFSGENSTDLKAKLDPGQDVKTQLVEAANALHDGKIKVEQYDAETQQLTYTVKTGAYEFTTYTAGVRKVDDALRTVQGTTKRTETLLESITRKTKEVFTYFSGSSIIYKGIEELRRGIQYVREIDNALTELKKVTDETEESYERFLDTASKTADKVGSTIADVVNSTADWARIGYSLEDAASLAETTSVLLNVSEFSSIDEATSALTSTLQAFGYTADNAMNVVDVMNEVGKFVAPR